MRERHAVEHLEPVAAADAHERGREVAEAVQRQHGRLVERRHEERRRRVRLVMLDAVEARAKRVGRDAERRRQVLLHAAHAAHAPQPVGDVTGIAQATRGLHDLRAQVRARIAPERDVVDVARREAGVLETPRGGERREPRDVLQPAEALLLGGCDEHAVDDERRGGVAVIRVEPEDRRHTRANARSSSVATVTWSSSVSCGKSGSASERRSAA